MTPRRGGVRPAGDRVGETRRGLLARLAWGALGAAAAPRRSPGDAGAPDGGPAGTRQDGLLLAPGLAYLDTGSLGPLARRTFERTIEAGRDLEREPSRVGYGPALQAMEEVRGRAARWLGCAVDDLALTGSTTEGMNAIAQGIDWRPGDRLLTSDQEHPGGTSCWRHAARRHGVIVDTVAIARDASAGDGLVERFAAAVTPRTRAISVSHVLATTGLRLPIAELAALARSRGCLLVVDGAQAAGVLAVDLAALGCDAYATCGHKWLLGPKGTGMLFLRGGGGGPGRRPIDPIAFEGGMAAYSASAGMPDIPAILGLGEALADALAAGPAAIERRAVGLRDRLHAELAERPRLRLFGPPPGPSSSSLLAVGLPPELDAGAVVERLRRDHGVVVKHSPPALPNAVRVATHHFNRPDDLERLVRGLDGALGAAGR